LKDEGLEIDAYAGEAVLDRYVDPEELGRDNHMGNTKLGGAK
jgi:hypothetical protein